jgi:SSS family solute:Na+ symporter
MQSVSTVVYENFYKPMIRKKRPISDSEGLKVLHLTSAVVGSAIVGLAMMMSNIRSIMDIFFEWAGFLDGGLLGLFLLGFVFKYIRSAQVIFTLTIGVIMMFLVNAPTIWENFPINLHIHFMLNCETGIATMLFLGFFFNMWAKRKGSAQGVSQKV